jgi:hypothetical protein
MTHRPGPQWKYVLPLLPLLILAVAILGERSFRKSSSIAPKNPGNNPQDFFVWATNSNFSYSFRYDPRAADEWLFHSGARLFATSLPPTLVTWPTN